eukprot:GHVO01028682.1.p2 GENE.GHVO01028682.1~~GHVO01028682.1.p2  ORF type:complete len:182 (+),score=42.97 GHVO01028682.1:748-1293(+)
MKVYKDIFSNDEMISDSYVQLAPFEKDELLDVAFEVVSRRVKKGGEDFGISANVDEDAEEGAVGDASQNSETVIDVTDAFKMQPTSFSKKEFGAYVKAYMGHVKAKLAETNPDRVTPFISGAQTLIKEILGKFDEFEFYFGESGFEHLDDCQAALVFSYYKGEEETPRFIFIKDGLVEEKY